MDRLRSCYRVPMRFYTDDNRTCMVQYYFVEPGTPMLPYSTPFRSLNWMPDSEAGVYDGLGEDYLADRTWVNGFNVGSANAANGHVCGTAQQWHDGQPLPPVPPVPLDLFGTPACCGDPAVASVKIRTAGFAFQGGAATEDFRGLNSTPNFFNLFRSSDPTVFENLFGETSDFEHNPPVLVFHPAVWFARFTPGKVEVGWSIATVNPPGDFTVLYTGVESAVTVPLPIDPSQAGGVGTASSTVEIPGYAPTAEVDVLIGSIVWDAGSDAIPAGYLLANGQAVSRSVYSLLFGRLGTLYGPGDGSTTFNLPSLAGRVAMGYGASHPQGQTGGEETHTLSDAETPLAAHTHPIDPMVASVQDPALIDSISSSPGNNAVQGVADSPTGFCFPNFSALSNPQPNVPTSAVAHNNLQPYLALRPLIYAGV